MLERIQGLPDHVIGFEARGEVTGADYETVLIPAVEDALTRHRKIRCLYRLGAEFEKFDVKAMWDDARVGLQHLRAWERVAIVTDVGWIRGAMQALGFIIPGEFKVFVDAELDQARQWLCEP